jgi:glycerophosphoryl diester phosphodiesterase
LNRTLVVAHRGAVRGAAENTLESFAKAIDIGADMIEFDVRRTRTGELIAFHDSHINDVPLAQLTRAEIARKIGAEPALFTDIVGLSRGKIGLDVELKEDGYVGDVVNVLRESHHGKQLIVSSFLENVLIQVKPKLPNAKTVLLLGRENPKPVLRTRLRELYPVGMAKAIDADYVGPHRTLAHLGVVRRAAAAGLPSFVWTVNSAKRIRKFAADPDVAAIITDDPALALRIVAQVHDRGGA